MTDIHTWADADLALHNDNGSVPRRKIANNTYLIRHDDKSISVRLHDTNIVTYTITGDVLISTGGWLTNTTLQRVNLFTPDAVWVGRKGKTLRVLLNKHLHLTANGEDAAPVVLTERALALATEVSE